MERLKKRVNAIERRPNSHRNDDGGSGGGSGGGVSGYSTGLKRFFFYPNIYYYFFQCYPSYISDWNLLKKTLLWVIFLYTMIQRNYGSDSNAYTVLKTVVAFAYYIFIYKQILSCDSKKNKTKMLSIIHYNSNWFILL